MLAFIELVFVIGVAVAIPGTPPHNGASDECQVALEREQCMKIYEEAVNAPGPVSMKEWFQHYCKKITDFVPCLQENEADYETLSHCPEGEDTISAVVSRLDYLMPWGELFNITIDFIDTMNDVMCTRTDEIINLLNCIKKKAREFYPIIYSCGGAVNELGTKLGHNEEVTTAEFCSATYGYTSCMKDGLIKMCGLEYSDLLDTAYYDIVEDVIGEGFGCEESTPLEPLLEFARSVRNSLKK